MTIHHLIDSLYILKEVLLQNIGEPERKTTLLFKNIEFKLILILLVFQL